MATRTALAYGVGSSMYGAALDALCKAANAGQHGTLFDDRQRLFVKLQQLIQSL
jgi:hypothetical protein